MTLTAARTRSLAPEAPLCHALTPSSKGVGTAASRAIPEPKAGVKTGSPSAKFKELIAKHGGLPDNYKGAYERWLERKRAARPAAARTSAANATTEKGPAAANATTGKGPAAATAKASATC